MGDCVLTVFFEGTSNPLFDDDSNITTQLGLFFGLVRAEDLSDPITTPDGRDLLQMGFDGCGVAFRRVRHDLGGRPRLAVRGGRGTRARASGAGPRPRAARVRRAEPRRCAALMLAQRLAGYDAEQLSLCLLLFDPVPEEPRAERALRRPVRLHRGEHRDGRLALPAAAPRARALPAPAAPRLCLPAPLLPLYHNLLRVVRRRGGRDARLPPGRALPAARAPSRGAPSSRATPTRTSSRGCCRSCASRASSTSAARRWCTATRCSTTPSRSRGTACTACRTCCSRARRRTASPTTSAARARSSKLTGKFLNLHHRLLASNSSCIDLRSLAERTPTTPPENAGGAVLFARPRRPLPPAPQLEPQPRPTPTSAPRSGKPIYMLAIHHNAEDAPAGLIACVAFALLCSVRRARRSDDEPRPLLRAHRWAGVGALDA